MTAEIKQNKNDIGPIKDFRKPRNHPERKNRHNKRMIILSSRSISAFCLVCYGWR